MNATKLIDKHIAELTDWRGKMMARLRKVILSVDSGISEEFKWNTPVFIHNGNVCAIGVFNDHVKVNFFKGASLADPKKLFNAGLEAKASRGIDLHEGEKIDETALKNLVRVAVSLNKTSKK
ncbi:DUF1801 domain-containing protein [bacterium]|nr:DUF1801 domain-containing protein [bacterium]